jgi:uncharacterized protein YwqG
MPASETILPMLEEHGLQRVAEALAACARPSIRLRASGLAETQATRLGGRPNLPSAVKWPRWQGSPMTFVAQVDLDPLPSHEIGLPQTGTLYFFCEGAAEGMWAVAYYPVSVKDHPARRFPKDLELQLPSVELGWARAEPSMPDREDAFFGQLGLTEDEGERYDEFLWEWAREHRGLTGIHRLGGYPDVIQSDPKFEAHQSSRANDYADVQKISRGAIDWRLLLQVDSEVDAGICWADAGKLYFLIHKSDLRSRRFSETWMVVQC